MALDPLNYTPDGDKSSKFLDAIQKFADEQRDKINNEVQQFKAAQLKNAEDDGIKDAYTLIHKEMEAMNISISSEMAKREEKGKAEIYKRRNDITAEVFTEAKKQLKNFTSSEAYVKQLEQDIKEIASFFGNKRVVLYVHEADKALCQTFLSFFTGTCSIEAAKDICIGGVKAICPDDHTMVDKSLDTKLDAQKDWFYKNANLKVF